MLTLKETYERLNEIKREIELLNEKYKFIDTLLENPKYTDSEILLTELEELFGQVIELKIEEAFYKLQTEKFEDIEIIEYYDTLEDLEDGF